MGDIPLPTTYQWFIWCTVHIHWKYPKLLGVVQLIFGIHSEYEEHLFSDKKLHTSNFFSLNLLSFSHKWQKLSLDFNIIRHARRLFCSPYLCKAKSPFFVVVLKFELPNAQFLNFPKSWTVVLIQLVLIIRDCMYYHRFNRYCSAVAMCG